MFKTIIFDFIYSRYPNYFLRNINKLLHNMVPVKLPPSGLLTISLRGDKKIKLFTNQSDHVCFCVFWDGVYNYEYVEIFEELIRQCKTFIDIGANAGLYSQIAARVSPGIQVLAFDPTDSAYHYQKKNIDVNGVADNVKTYQLAVSDQEGEVALFKVKNPKYKNLKYNLGGASGFIEKPVHFEEMRVNTDSIDHFIAQNHPSLVPDFVKIDAEQAEALIIRGMQQVIKTYKPIIVCEVLFDSGLDELEKEFKAMNYRFYFHLDGRLKEVGSLAAKKDFKEVKNCFFVPGEKRHMIEKWLLSQS